MMTLLDSDCGRLFGSSIIVVSERDRVDPTRFIRELQE